MSNLVTIFGGSGFVGTQVVQALARAGYRVRVAVRRPDLAGHVRPLGGVGQVVPVQANVRNYDSVVRAVRGSDIVINLVGIGFESGRQRFRAVNTMGARNVAAAARAAGAARLVHLSSLGADAQSPSVYARTKALGEAEVLTAFPEAVIVSPSIVFGPGDGFFNLLGSLAARLPVLPLFGGKSRFQPIYVGDVAQAVLAAAEGKVAGGRVYELGGAEIETHKALWERVLRLTNRKGALVPMPIGVGKLMAAPLALLPMKPLVTADQMELLQLDNVVSDAAIAEGRDLSAFGITPTPMDAVLPTYLWRFLPNGQFDRQTA